MVKIPSDVLVICKKCGNKAPSSVMKLDLDEKLTICPDCVKNKKIHNEIKGSMPAKKGVQPAVKSNYVEDDSLKSVHKCSYCSYKFPINLETRKPRNCPYCGKEAMSFRI